MWGAQILASSQGNLYLIFRRSKSSGQTEKVSDKYEPNDPAEEYTRAILAEDKLRDYVESLAQFLPKVGEKSRRFGERSGAFVYDGEEDVMRNVK